jgi:indole-3-glycerol phosphate synthase
MDILHHIVADTRQLVASRKRVTPIAKLEDMPSFSAPCLDLADSLCGEGLSVIAEIKKASPSRGIIRNDFNVAQIANQYGHSGAAAISVLTEPLYFKGSLEHLAIARKATDLPLLRKDFIVDPYQLYEARAFGADAVLLIASVLDASELSDLYEAAVELGLSVLVEIYEISELDRIDFDQVRILGVNNRDLRTFDVDIDHSVRVFQTLPSAVIKVSESGLADPADLAYIERHGANAVLIGEAFMKAPEPGKRLRAFLSESKAFLEAAGHLRLVV